MSQTPPNQNSSNFAPAAQPVSGATVIHTDAIGLATGMVEIDAPDGRKLPAYFARPEGVTAPPVVLVVQEIFGVHEHIKDVARRLARLGYFAVAPELYFRQGDPSTIGDIERLRVEIVNRVPDAQVLGDLDASMAWAGDQGGDLDRLGIVGFCWGGRIVWLYAAHEPRLRVAAAWYGRLIGPATPTSPRHPLEVAAELKAPVLGLYGGQDAGIPLDTITRMNDSLYALGSASHIKLYPEAPHAFYADYRPSYRAADAADGWQSMLAWFRQHGL